MCRLPGGGVFEPATLRPAKFGVNSGLGTFGFFSRDVNADNRSDVIGISEGRVVIPFPQRRRRRLPRAVGSDLAVHVHPAFLCPGRRRDGGRAR
ncbi:hypothetical protein [Nonomuraea sp. NPDC049480]|uniref:hypothetical protein n=1 Tax=Nonomuraea sp. NPDC049480 TaxID=3364353 RepID=UPI0037A46D2E